MAYPTDQVVTGDLITAAQINRWPVMIADSVLGSAAASFDFTSIPAHWSHLMVVLYGRGDTAATSTSLYVRFNNDSGSNYDALGVNVKHSGVVSSGETVAGSQILASAIAAANAPASAFDCAVMFIPHYAGTTGHKCVTSYGSLKLAASTGNLFQQLGPGWWRSTAAINRVTVLSSAGNFVADSRCSIYGMGRI